MIASYGVTVGHQSLMITPRLATRAHVGVKKQSQFSCISRTHSSNLHNEIISSPALQHFQQLKPIATHSKHEQSALAVVIFFFLALSINDAS